MAPSRSKSRLAPAMIVAGFLCAMLAVAYVAGYLMGSTVTVNPSYKERAFYTRLQTTIYRPAAQAESAMTGTRVLLYYHSNTVLCY